MRLTCLLLIPSALAIAADDPYAAALFQKNCATCHQAGGEAAARIPQLSVLKTRTPKLDSADARNWRHETAGGRALD